MLDWLRTNRLLLRLAGDILAVELALFLARLLRPALPFGQKLGPEHTALPVIVYVLVAGIWIATSLISSVYTRHRQRAVEEAQTLLIAVTLTTFVLAGMLFFSFREVSRLQIILFYVLHGSLLIGSRLAARLVSELLARAPRTRRRVLIVGAGELGREMMNMLERHLHSEAELVGFLDDEIPVQTGINGYPVLGRIEEAEQVVRSLSIQEAVLALPFQGYDRFFQIITALQRLQITIRIVPDHVKLSLFRTALEEFARVPVITLQKAELTHFERQVKRAFDLVLGSICFTLSLPLLIVSAIAIRLDSKGPVLLKQRRVGENGKAFDMHKFRSMVEGAEDLQDGLISTDPDGLLSYKRAGDPRVTRVGRMLRRLSIDELPQLINVLKGEMSLVGPRPELPWVVENYYEPWQTQRFLVPQGMTGWWQVNGRSDKPMHLHTEEDLFYIQNYSLLLDIQILWKTIGAVVKGKGAY